MIESPVEQGSPHTRADRVEPDPKRVRPADRPLSLGVVTAWRLAILAALLIAWQYLPQIDYLAHRYRLLNPFFISSPQRVYERLSNLMTASHGYPSVWPYLWNTVSATLIGAAIGLTIGTTLGLLFSNSPALSQVLSPYVYFFNSIPRIALIPVVVLLVGPTVRASEIACALVVTFLTFYNAFTGGRSVPSQVLQNVEIFGAKGWQIAYYVRGRYVLIWTFAAIPNAIAFGSSSPWSRRSSSPASRHGSPHPGGHHECRCVLELRSRRTACSGRDAPRHARGGDQAPRPALEPVALGDRGNSLCTTAGLPAITSSSHPRATSSAASISSRDVSYRSSARSTSSPSNGPRGAVARGTAKPSRSQVCASEGWSKKYG